MLRVVQRYCALEGYKQYNIVQMRWKCQQDDCLRPHEQFVLSCALVDAQRTCKLIFHVIDLTARI